MFTKLDKIIGTLAIPLVIYGSGVMNAIAENSHLFNEKEAKIKSADRAIAGLRDYMYELSLHITKNNLQTYNRISNESQEDIRNLQAAKVTADSSYEANRHNIAKSWAYLFE